MSNKPIIILKSMKKNFSFLIFIIAMSCVLTGWTFRSNVRIIKFTEGDVIA